MNRKSSKYWPTFTTVVILFGLLNSGCLQLKENSYWNRGKRINMLEEQVESLSDSMGSLSNKNYELKKNLSELEAIKNQLNKEYAQIKEKQIDIEKAQASHNEARDHLEAELTETQNLLEKMKQQLTLVEKDKNNLKAKLEKPEAPHTKNIETETVEAETADDRKTIIPTDSTRESLIKDTQEKRKASLVEELLDKAIQLYRQEKFEEAIAKWKEAMALDPSKLEAKFNIEIAQDRIKEKQIQEDLKSTRTQRK